MPAIRSTRWSPRSAPTRPSPRKKWNFHLEPADREIFISPKLKELFNAMPPAPGALLTLTDYMWA
jgi:hypothetical protein